MATLKQEAMDYKPMQTKNIAELEIVNTDLDLKEEEGINDDTQKPFSYKYVEINGEKYRVPVSVIKSLQAILKENPKLTKFKVKKQGEGLKTSYTVIPLM